MADNRVQTVIGGSPGSVVLKLVLLSLLVGVVLAAFGMTPWGFFRFLREVFEDLVGTGMDAVRRIAGYLISGAVIVVPIWLLMRVMRARKA